MSEPAITRDQLEEMAEAVACRVVELLRQSPAATEPRLVDAGTLADALGCTRDFVYRNADQLDAIRLPGGTDRPRLRFDLERAVAAHRAAPATPEPTPATPSPRRRKPAVTGLLPIRGGKAA